MHTTIVRILREELGSLLALAIVVWLGALAVERFMVPQTASAYERARAVTEYDSLLAETGDYAALRGKLETVNDSLDNRLALLSAGMSDANDLSALLEMLIDRAKKADIRFVRVQPTGQEEVEGYTMYPVVLEFSTGYAALGRFVAGLEAQPHVARVERLAISAKSAGEVRVVLLVAVFLKSKGGEG